MNNPKEIYGFVGLHSYVNWHGETVFVFHDDMGEITSTKSEVKRDIIIARLHERGNYGPVRPIHRSDINRTHPSYG